MAERALEGLRVLEFDKAGETQFAGKILADMGADVIKVEPIGGVAARRVPPFFRDVEDANASLYFWHYNTSKRSIEVNLADAADANLVALLLEHTDVILDGVGLQGQIPGFSESWQEKYPRLLYCRVTPFGNDGPWAGFLSSDIIQLAGGVSAECGYEAPGTPPISPSGGQANHLAGLMSAIGVMAGLCYRDRAGIGQEIDVAAHDVVAVSTEMGIPFWEFQHVNVVRQGGRHARPEVSAPWMHLCADGKYFCALPLYLDDRRFAAMSEWFESEGMSDDLMEPEYRDGSYRNPRMDHIIDVIRRFCLQHESGYLFYESQKRRLPWAPVNSPDELCQDPHLSEDRGVFEEVAHEELNRHFLYPGAPYKLSGTPWEITRRPPLLGEHNQEVWGETLTD